MAAAVEPLYKHLEVKCLVISGSNAPKPDDPLNCEMVPVNTINFKVTRTHAELFLRAQNKRQVSDFFNIMVHDLMRFSTMKTSLRNKNNNGLVPPDTWDLDDVSQAVNSCYQYFRDANWEDVEAPLHRYMSRLLWDLRTSFQRNIKLYHIHTSCNSLSHSLALFSSCYEYDTDHCMTSLSQLRSALAERFTLFYICLAR